MINSRNFLVNQIIQDIQNIGIDATMTKYQIGRKKLHKICDELNIAIPRRGRPLYDINMNDIQYVKQYLQNANVGYQRLFEVVKRDPNAPSGLTEWKIRTIYESLDLFTRVQEYVPHVKEHQLKFVAKYAGQAWHTDLHELKVMPCEEGKLYLIAFIDDRSRMIMHHEILKDKTSLSAMNALVKSLSKNGYF